VIQWGPEVNPKLEFKPSLPHFKPTMDHRGAFISKVVRGLFKDHKYSVLSGNTNWNEASPNLHDRVVPISTIVEKGRFPRRRIREHPPRGRYVLSINGTGRRLEFEKDIRWNGFH
jgi:hypothetical protein